MAVPIPSLTDEIFIQVIPEVCMSGAAVIARDLGPLQERARRNSAGGDDLGFWPLSACVSVSQASGARLQAGLVGAVCGFHSLGLPLEEG